MDYHRNASWVLRVRTWSWHALQLALLSVVVSTASRMILAQLGATLVFATYFPAVLIVAVFAGIPGAVLVTALTTVIAWWAYFPPTFEFGQLTGTQTANLVTFWLSASLIIWLSHIYRMTVAHLIQSEKARELLVGELNHRAGNMLAVMQAIISGTVTVESDRSAVIDRIQALSRANELVSKTSKGHVSLLALLQSETQPYGATDRIQVEGPQILLDGEIARSVSLVLHELLTNAAKYGALSNGSGKLQIRWSQDDGKCRFSWTETEGPAVVTPPKLGFGSRMMKASLAQINGLIETEFRPEGYSCVLTFGTVSSKNFGNGAV